MSNYIDVTNESFESAVIESSRHSVVVVDFWAAWCGPCRMLAPVLEKLCEEYGFVLAKLNTDENPDIAKKYNIGGIPDVRIFSGGKEVDGFVGALPEQRIREVFNKYAKSEVDDILAQIAAETDKGKASSAYGQLIKDYPNNKKVLMATAEFYLSIKNIDEAEKLLSKITEDDTDHHPRAQALRGIIGFIRECVNPNKESELDKMYADASCLVLQNKHAEALAIFLEVLKKDRKYRDDGARKAMITIFNILGPANSLVLEYRQKLSMALH